MGFFLWTIIDYGGTDELKLLPLKASMEDELNRRYMVLGRQDDRSCAWKSIIDLDFSSEGVSTTDSEHEVETSERATNEELIPGNHIDQPNLPPEVENRRVTNHAAILEVGVVITKETHILQPLNTRAHQVRQILPGFMPIPFVIFSAFQEINPVREKQQWSGAWQRLNGANTFLEALCIL
ncbi:hypothetical protein F5Y08DRAFT_301248 [Xylaria arbuscula]|nr:hypothetical protein F5Y08DRAFT_301248 [Xylaria arbuscula]